MKWFVYWVHLLLTQELVLVNKIDVSDADFTFIHVVLEVEAALFQPLEIVCILYILFVLKVWWYVKTNNKLNFSKSRCRILNNLLPLEGRE